MRAALSPEALDVLFLSARTHRAWFDHPVSNDILRRLYDLLKMGPPSTNCCPGRFVFVRSKGAKRRLAPALNPANVDRTMTAPVTVIVATDTQYHQHLPELWLHDDAPRLKIVNDAALGDTKAFRNATLQGGYLIIAAPRAVLAPHVNLLVVIELMLSSPCQSNATGDLASYNRDFESFDSQGFPKVILVQQLRHEHEAL